MRSKLILTGVLLIIGGLVSFSNAFAEMGDKFTDQENPGVVSRIFSQEDEKSETVQGEKAQYNGQIQLFNGEERKKIIEFQNEYWKIRDADIAKEKFLIEPIVGPTAYTVGTFREETLNNAVDYINLLRKSAGMSPVRWTEERVEFAQYSSIANSALRTVTHDLNSFSKPEGMTDEFWQQAIPSAAYSNISRRAYRNFTEVPIPTLNQLTDHFMYDNGSGNQIVGHRTVILGPAYRTVGFGFSELQIPEERAVEYVSSYSAHRDGLGTTVAEDFITSWPTAGVFPKQYTNLFSENEDFRWSVHFYQKGYSFNSEQLKVTLTNNHTGETWNFSDKQKDGEFTVVNYREYNSIVFSPKGLRYSEGDSFTVKVEGLNGKQDVYQYQTKLYDLAKNYEVPVESIGFDFEGKNLNMGEQVDVLPSFTPENATNKKVNWEISDPNIASIDQNGKIIALNKGTAIVTATSHEGGHAASFTLEVTEPVIPLEEFYISEQKVNLLVGQTHKLNVGYIPTDAEITTEWSSSDEKIARVDQDGTITGISNGKVEITVTEKNRQISTKSVVTVETGNLYCGIPWTWDEDSQTVTFGSGTLREYSASKNIHAEIEGNKILNGQRIKEIIFTDTVTLTGNMEELFSSLYNLESIKNIDKLDTANVTNMKRMFFGNGALESLDLSSWDTGKVTIMSEMFAYSKKLSSINLKIWNTKNVTDMSSMFYYAEKLQDLDVSSWDTRNVTTMSNMFSNIRALKKLDLSKWNTEKVKDMSGIFNWNTALASLNVTSWNTSSVTNMSGMFAYMYKLEKLDLSSWNTKSVTSIDGIFSRSINLNTLILGEETKFIGNVNLMENTDYPKTGRWINSQTKKAYENSKDFTLSQNEAGEYSREMYPDDTYYGVPWTWDVSTGTVTFGKGTIKGYVSSKNIKGVIEKSDLLEGMKIKEIVFTDTIILIGNMEELFSGFSNLESIKNIDKLDTANVTNMKRMFFGNGALESLDLSNWDTGKVTTMGEMFRSASKISNISFKSWDTKNVTDMNRMFFYAENIKEIDVSDWDTGKVTNMNHMFSNIRALKKLDLSNWNTEKVKDMSGIFNWNTALASLNVTGWDTSSVTNMSGMFAYMYKLEKLDISSWNTKSVTSMDGMFSRSTSLNTLVLGEETRFIGNVNLIENTNYPKTGRWINNRTGKIYTSSKELTHNQDEHGEYVREERKE